ncbi:molybdopterin-dependent oxidoreductase [Microbacterium sp. SORGH_AS_0888]|uniref:molybdopterin-dependent oxidoreductase n=1 Tax=Microbacterium sp. SORGH_AS_0888 TaxID=3041791 RepID=UPI002788C0BD|nr:molybdopterin-dependent oxidoreductase [Microbacterium sp. SORGH_AS_0888]MDQ1131047.1 DMSO/TMAO reductase YedYZ molybdopterin-dependent catalytic subunit [Microbacterium sp. SORGH_AS_0888]
MGGRRFAHRAWAALSGIVAAAVLLAASELIAAFVAPQASPLLAVGSFVIDIVPRPLKEFAISTFGSFDKPALLIGLGIAVAVAAAVAGLLQAWRTPWGAVLLATGGTAGTAAVATRAGASLLALVPPVVGTVAGVAVLVLLVARLRRWTDAVRSAPATGSAEEAAAAADAVSARGQGVDRRAFFRFALIAGASAVVIGAGSRIWTATTASIDGIRRALRLPAPQRTVTIPAGAELDIPGLTPLITPNTDFYRVDTALTVPQVDPSSWRLSVDGMVDEPFDLSFDDLLAMGVDEYGITLTCVSNEVGGDLVGNAIWLGVPVRDILARAKPQAGADMVLSHSVDGFTASTPLASLTDADLDAILAVGMNGEPLPLEHGFPVRMVVPGLYGYVSATKWLNRLSVTTYAKDEAYWTPRGYSAKAPIKFSSRVDTPKLGTQVSAGTVPIAGVAWAQTVGIARVEVSVDNGPWQQATLSNPINDDTWVQWMMPWEATAGTHYIAVRAVDKAGNLQIEQAAPIAPDGSSGWQRTLVSVS